LLRFGFGPEAAGVAALSFRFDGMRGRLWRCSPIETNKPTNDFQFGLWHCQKVKQLLFLKIG
jgi:hypothetical protein